MDHSQKAYELFMQGYNCSQAVFAAFCDITGIDFELAIKLSSSFGGGMGRLREVCGAVSGMMLVAGALYGYNDPKDSVTKSEHYKRVQTLAYKFQEENGSYICKTLLGLDSASDPNSPQRTNEYYKKRPCAELVRQAAAILDDYIKNHDV
ncbi:MAG: C_GCAxxG_C_C family protein [Oscillospiraceae bacterium]|nr:C_GCAxxG_C_C family protein [Oscillospiraceae bacterium]